MSEPDVLARGTNGYATRQEEVIEAFEEASDDE